MDGNAEAFEVLQACSTQARYAGMGGFVGLDYVAVGMIAESFGIETPPAFWRKVRAVEDVMLKQAKEEMGKGQS